MESIKTYDFLSQEECDTIVNKILSLEDTVKKLGPDIYGGTSEDSLTGRFYCFNYLNVPEINIILEPKLKKIFGPCVVQCWANILRQGEGIEAHSHNAPGQSDWSEATGNIFLYGDPTTGTYYKFPVLNPLHVKYDNKVGEFSLFSPNLVHGVPNNISGDMRISMAIDVRFGDEILLNTFVLTDIKRYYYIR